MGKLTYDEYYTLKRAGTITGMQESEAFRKLPMEVKELHNPVDWDYLDELTKTYSLSPETEGAICHATFIILLGSISIGELPTFIEPGHYPLADQVSPTGGVDRRVALQCAIKISRHFLKQCSEYMDIGNVDAYIEDWKDELSG